MALVLSADTSTGVISVALCRDAETLAELSVNAPKRHAERLVSLCDFLLAEVELGLHDVDLFAISTGPGSFTGLRIGVATWKGFALGCGKPLLGVPTLEALALASGIREGVVGVMLDAKMKEVYAATFHLRGGKLETLRPATVGPVEYALEGIEQVDVFLGDGAVLYKERILAKFPNADFVASVHGHPRASVVAQFALKNWHAGDPGNAGEVQPLYLRLSQPEEARKETATAGTP